MIKHVVRLPMRGVFDVVLSPLLAPFASGSAHEAVPQSLPALRP